MKKSTLNNIMIDLETLGTDSNSVILSISAIPFCPKAGAQDLMFNQNIDIQSCLDLGMKIDGATLQFWLEKDKELIRQITRDARPINSVLERFQLWWMQNGFGKNTKVWGKGPSFDCGLLADAFRLTAKERPWKYWNERCVRTELDGWEEFLKKKIPFEGILHHPLFDALHQIKCVQEVNAQELANQF